MIKAEEGWIVILNGAPRSGKSSIARAMQAALDQVWMNFGVDALMEATPSSYRPGIGLRPGAERPDLEPFVATLYSALYESVAAMSRLGLNVVVDVGHHDAYSRPLGIVEDRDRRLAGLPVVIVGVRCDLDVILQRREQGTSGAYLRRSQEGDPPGPVLTWQAEVHRRGRYDLEVDTSRATPEECTETIASHLKRREREGGRSGSG